MKSGDKVVITSLILNKHLEGKVGTLGQRTAEGMWWCELEDKVRLPGSIKAVKGRWVTEESVRLVETEVPFIYRYNIGDRIRVVKEGVYKGKEGVITDRFEGLYTVKFTDGTSSHWSEQWLVETEVPFKVGDRVQVTLDVNKFENSLAQIEEKKVIISPSISAYANIKQAAAHAKKTPSQIVTEMIESIFEMETGYIRLKPLPTQEQLNAIQFFINRVTKETFYGIKFLSEEEAAIEKAKMAEAQAAVTEKVEKAIDGIRIVAKKVDAVSACHEAKVSYDGETEQYFCEECHNACDIHVPVPESKIEETIL
jgi:hypothetical protein